MWSLATSPHTAQDTLRMNLGRLRLGLPLLVRPGAEEEEEEAGEALSRGFHDPKFPLESILPAIWQNLCPSAPAGNSKAPQ